MADLAALATIPPYLFIGVRRFYGESRVRTFLKLAFVSVAYLFMVVLTLLLMIAVSVLTF